MRQLFRIEPDRDRLGNAEPLSAIWPKYEAPVVRLASSGARELVRMHWGFLTPKTSEKTGKPLKPDAWNNARDDKLRRNGLWKDSFLHRRCLIPATSFREAKGRNPATDVWFAITGEEPRRRVLRRYGRARRLFQTISGQHGLLDGPLPPACRPLTSPLHGGLVRIVFASGRWSGGRGPRWGRPRTRLAGRKPSQSCAPSLSLGGALN